MDERLVLHMSIGKVEMKLSRFEFLAKKASKSFGSELDSIIVEAAQLYDELVGVDAQLPKASRSLFQERFAVAEATISACLN